MKKSKLFLILTSMVFLTVFFAQPALAEDSGDFPKPPFHPRKIWRRGWLSLPQEIRQEFKDWRQDLTQEERAALRAKRREGKKERHEAMAEFLDLTEEELTSRWQEGKTLKEILEEQGKTQEDWLDFLKGRRHQSLDELVAEGTITQEEADSWWDKLGDFWAGTFGRWF